ncbi:unnamed protein product, partial [Mesorhabditis belari]|uniref:Uncharacterized protein n=1 Tax=Mesorhabditis belari TaxID=2138241 RepID=A0AAF3ESH9_9BILA
MVIANIVLCINSLIGYLCNGILIYLVQRNPNSRMGTYRYLILVLAVFNIVYATAHLLVIPINENGNLRFNLRPWICLTVCMTQMSGMFCVILYCGWSMHRKLSSSEMASERGYRLQKQLFQALLIQFIVPIILEYIPCTAIFLVPMLGEEVNLEWATMGISLYPVFEPIVVIYFVREYRLGLSVMIFGKKSKTAISHTSEMVTQHSNSDSNLKDSKSTQRIANDKISTLRKN